MNITLAELIADKYVSHLDMNRLSKLDYLMLHAIKSVAMGEWARNTLQTLKQSH